MDSDGVFSDDGGWYQCTVDTYICNCFTYFLPFFAGVLEYYHASLEPIMQYPYLRTYVFQGFREIGNAILFCLQLEGFLVSNYTFHFMSTYQFTFLKCDHSNESY